MIRVGIITFQESRNYGAMLQAFALKKAIEGLGYKTDIINYHSKEKEEQYSRFSLHRSFLVNLNTLLSIFVSKNTTKKIDRFKKEHLCLNAVALSRRELTNLNEQYDKFICGSDQIWNPKSIKNDGTFFLDFVSDENKKISYAPSVGVTTIDDADLEFFRNGVNGIRYLSVREKSGARLIYDLTGRESHVVLDPTLLIDKEKWYSLTQDEKNKKGYIFLYMVGYTPKAVSLAKELAKEKGLEVVTPIKTIRDLKDGFKPFAGGPLEFINEIRNASYVITTSFHGLMFSIIFHKKFLTVEKPASKSKTASRIDDFLSLANLSDRKFSGDMNAIDNEIDYRAVDSIIAAMRQDSLDFLKNSLHS